MGCCSTAPPGGWGSTVVARGEWGLRLQYSWRGCSTVGGAAVQLGGLQYSWGGCSTVGCCSTAPPGGWGSTVVARGEWGLRPYREIVAQRSIAAQSLSSSYRPVAY